MGMIILKENQNIVIKSDGAEYIVKDGTVQVVLQPYAGKRQLRKMFLGLAEQGDYIPVPVFPADTSDYGADRFVVILKAENGEASLNELPPFDERTDTLREYLRNSLFSLSENAGFLGSFETPEQLWESVLKQYKSSIDEKLGKIKGQEKENKEIHNRVSKIISSSFLFSFSMKHIKTESNDKGTYDAAAFLCERSGISIISYEDMLKSFDDPKDTDFANIARLSGFSVREAVLPPKWYKRAENAFIGFINEDDTEKEIVVFPHFGRLKYFNPASGEIKPVTKDIKNRIGRTVLIFDRTFDKQSIRIGEMLKFAVKEITISDILVLFAATMLLSFVGVALSSLNQSVYGEIIPGQKADLAYVVGIIFLATLVANFLFSIAKSLTDYRIMSKTGNAIQLAIFHRIFHLPENYFRGKESAEQAYRITQLSSNYVSILKSGMDLIISLVFSVVYFHRMFKCSSALSRVGIILSSVGIVVMFITGIIQSKTSRQRMRKTAEIRSFLYQAVTGIETVRMAGAENAVLEKYMEKEGVLQERQGKIDRIQRVANFLMSFFNSMSILIMYWIMGNGKPDGMNLGLFMGFISAYSMFSTQMMSAATTLSTMVVMMPLLKDTGELLMTLPESGADGRVLSGFMGDIKLSHVSYGYKGSEKTVIDDLSLHISPGEYVGIVGESGCGKTTLLRLLLGFETPDKGQIFYDNVPMSKLNIVELRRKLGAVLQDGKLVSGSILQNIKIASPGADSEAVDRVVESVGLTDEIGAMPMGLLTHVSEDALTISGGQKQRILIARAVIGSPKVMLFDEATSSLDNIAQEKISNALAEFASTRIVVAHRLSTVKLCDRILVMDGGRIVESGSYNELMEGKGKFYEMVKVQQVV